MESAAQQPGEDEDEPEPFLQLGAAVAPPDAESDDEDQEVVPIAGANEPDVLTSRDDSAGSAQRADAEAALKAAAALAHPAAEAAKAAAEAMEDPAEAAEAAEAAMEEDRVRVEVPHDTLPVSSSSEPPLPQDLPPPLDTDPHEQAPRLRSVSQESPRPPQPTDATQPEEVSHLPRGTRVFLSGGPESVGAYNGHAGVVQAYHETAEAYTVQLDSSGPQDLTVLQVSRHNVTAEAEGSPLPPLSLALPVQDVQDTLQDSSIARDPTLQSVGRSSELDTLHSLHINPGSILGRVLLAYCSQVAKRPKRLLFLYILCAVVPLVVGILFRGFALETDFNAFIKADGSAMRDREAYQLAYEEKKDLTGGRRLEEVQPFLQVDEWIEEVEAEDAEGVRRLLEENYTTAPGRRLRTLFLRKELQLLYRAKNGNILDDKALQDIQAIEEGFRTLPGVRNLCYTRITSESNRFLCDPGISLVAMAFPTQSSSSQGRAFLEFTWDGMGRDLVPPAAVLAYMKTAAEYGDSSRTSRRYFPKTWTYPDVGDFQAESAMPDAARTKFSYHLTLGQNGDPVSQVNANIGKTKEEWNKLITTEMLPYFHKVQSEQVEFYYASTDIDSIEVARLIEQARVDTESKVKMELKQIRSTMVAMDERLDQMLAHLDGLQPQENADTLTAEAVAGLLSKTEQQWGQEIRTLKQELHQTILAHNHNADLIKHHKDTIDALRERCGKMTTSSSKSAEIQQQLRQLDARLKQQQKQRKLEPLFERLNALEMRVTAGSSAQAWGAAASYPRPAAPTLPRGIGAPPGIEVQAVAPGLKSGPKAAAGAVSPVAEESEEA